MDKIKFKKTVLDWIAENKIDISKQKVRVYNYRGNWEVRIYAKPMEIVNTRNSFRECKEERDETRHGSYGKHVRMISNYIHISENDFNNKEEKAFILDMLQTEYGTKN